MEEIFDYLTSINNLNTQVINTAISYCNDTSVLNISREHRDSKNREPEIGFNLFHLISDIYYRENFHSDILKALLDRKERHNEGSKFLQQFIKYINTANDKDIYLNWTQYEHADVYRELGRIDVLIKDETSKRAIIIENKINKAGDQYRQIPRYVEGLEQQGYKVDAVIYLLLNYHLKPDTYGWTEQERGEIMPKLITIPAYKESQMDLVNGWLHKCERLTTNIDALFIFRQYQKLIQQLGQQAMNKEVMQKFYDNVLQGDHYRTALSIKDMLNDLQAYRIERILDNYIANHNPFERIWNWQNKAAVFDRFDYKGNILAIDIYPESSSYKFHFFSRSSLTGELTLEQILEKMGINDFVKVNERMHKSFKFPEQEKDLYEYIDSFKAKLVNLKLEEEAPENQI